VPAKQIEWNISGIFRDGVTVALFFPRPGGSPKGFFIFSKKKALDKR